MTSAPRYAVIPADGHYGDYATVVSTHATRAAALRAAKPDATSPSRWAVIETTTCRKGDRISRAEAQIRG